MKADKSARYDMASALSDAAINHCPHDIWDKIQSYSETNWSVSPDTLIRMAIYQLFNLEY